MNISTIVFLLYFIMTGISFLGMTDQLVEEIWKPRGVQPGTLEHDVATVYTEVIGAFCLMVGCTTCPGARGWALAATCLVGIMAKHIMVNDLMPPPMVMALAGGMFLSSWFSALTNNDGSKTGMWVSLLVNVINFVSFFMMPAKVITDTFPKATEGTLAGEVGARLLEAVTTMTGVLVLLSCPAPMGRAMGSTLLAAFLTYHHFQYALGPPLPVQVFCAVNLALQWYAVVNKGGKSAHAKSS